MTCDNHVIKLDPMNAKVPTVIFGTSAIVGHLYSQVPMLKVPKSVNSKKTGGSDLDHPKAVSSSDKAILYACLYVCMCVRVRVGAYVRACLSVTQGLDTLFFK